MVNEAALTAARFNRKAVHMYDFEIAKDKVLMGAERKSMLLSEDDKRDTAYHEAGHVLVAAKRDHSDPLHKVTIIPRGMALGVTMHLPEEDKHTVHQGLSRHAAGHPDGWALRGGDLYGPHDHRRGQ
jgi:cell division protease FtsH